MKSLSKWLEQARLTYAKRIWEPPRPGESRVQRSCFFVLRAISITVSGLDDFRIFGRAAALSYSSLLGIGPLAALTVLVAGFILDQSDPRLAIDTMNRVLRFVAPQVVQYEIVTSPEETERRLETPAEAGTVVERIEFENPHLIEILEGFIAATRSGTVGVIGTIMLVIIVIQLFTTVEIAFNDIWGVRRGRRWTTRVTGYWTVVTLGSVVIFAGLALLTAGALANIFGLFPFGRQLFGLLEGLGPWISFLLIALVLATFYRFIPNTSVRWKPALVGAVIVVTLLFLNNLLAILYVRRVIITQSLYGSLGILPVFMLGMFVFWLFILIGGQITYAVQNANNRRSEVVWHELNTATREAVALSVLLLIGRRFTDCLAPLTAAQIGNILKVPMQVLNECLNRLNDIGLVATIPPLPQSSSQDFRFQPACPLNRLDLADFRRRFEHHGAHSGEGLLTSVDPLVDYYQERLAACLDERLGEKSLEDLFREFPVPPEPDPED